MLLEFKEETASYNGLTTLDISNVPVLSGGATELISRCDVEYIHVCDGSNSKLLTVGQTFYMEVLNECKFVTTTKTDNNIVTYFRFPISNSDADELFKYVGITENSSHPRCLNDGNFILTHESKLEIDCLYLHYTECLISMTELFIKFRDFCVEVQAIDDSNTISYSMIRHESDGAIFGEQNTYKIGDASKAVLDEKNAKVLEIIKTKCNELQLDILAYVETDLDKDEFPKHEDIKELLINKHNDYNIPDYLWEDVFPYWGKLQTRISRSYHGISNDILDIEANQDQAKRIKNLMMDVIGDIYKTQEEV